MQKVDNTDVSRVFERIADFLEFKNENPFKIRSYRLAAQTIADMRDSIADIAERGGSQALQEIDGVGKSISSQVIEILKSGTSPYLEELRAETPETVLDLRRVSGIGLKTAQTLYRDFGVRSLKELRALYEGGGLLSVPGIGEKTVGRIVRSLNRIEGNLD